MPDRDFLERQRNEWHGSTIRHAQGILEWLLFSKDVAIFILVPINHPSLYETYTVATFTANIRADESLLANNLQGHMSDVVPIVYKRIELGVLDRGTRNAFKSLARRE